jgi:hypothetical protein
MKRNFFETSVTQDNSELNRLPDYYGKIYFAFSFVVGIPWWLVYTIVHNLYGQIMQII